MRFFAPQKIKFDEMSNGLVLDILKFYTAQMKELQERYFKYRNSLVSYEYSDLMSFYDTESLIDLVDIDLEKYKKLKDFGNALRELVAKRAYLYLCKSSLSLQNRLKRFLKSSVPTEEYFVWSTEDYQLQVFKNGRIDFLSKQYFLAGNVVYFYDNGGFKNIYDVFPTCKQAEEFIIKDIRARYEKEKKVILIESDVNILKQGVNNYFESERQNTEEMKNE
jgi:hypothetical protein